MKKDPFQKVGIPNIKKVQLVFQQMAAWHQYYWATVYFQQYHMQANMNSISDHSNIWSILRKF